jgi:hypothetical protein
VVVRTVFNYIITITNVGNVGVANAVLRDTLPSGVRYLAANAACQPSGQTILCVDLSVPVGQSIQVRISVQSPGTPGLITNGATVNWAGGGSSSTSETTNVTLTLRDEPSGSKPLFLRTFLDIEPHDGAVRGRVVLNGSDAVEIGNWGPIDHRFIALPGENHIEAAPLGAAGHKGLWRFDFTTSPAFVRGSIRVASGQVHALDSASVVFAVDGEAPLRFGFLVDEPLAR